jgi:hypothetical protein
MGEPANDTAPFFHQPRTHAKQGEPALQKQRCQVRISFPRVAMVTRDG